MIRLCLVLVLAALFAGCATAPKVSSLCRAIGCIEPDAEDAAPVGAKLEFSQCAQGHGAMNTYKYLKAESGWSLVFYESVVSEKCGSMDGA
jgi:hypothetical protein